MGKLWVRLRISKVSRLSYLLMTLVLLLAGCAPWVSISSTRNPAVVGTLEPVAFIIYEGNTGAQYTKPLQAALLHELRARNIIARVEIITGAEFDEGSALEEYSHGTAGVVLIVPNGGTSEYGTLKQILYDVQALRITDPVEGKAVKMWRARVDSASGGFDAQVEARLRLLASELVKRLVVDKVLPPSGSLKKSALPSQAH